MSDCNLCKLPLERFQTFKEANGVVMCELCVAKVAAYYDAEKAVEARIVAWLREPGGFLAARQAMADAIEKGEHR
jgi:uncharacterized Zn finger protein (UPF0148 family)